jgi:hypothetical protein
MKSIEEIEQEIRRYTLQLYTKLNDEKESADCRSNISALEWVLDR